MSRLPALRASRDFRRVYRSGRRVKRNGVTVFVGEAQESEGRTGIVVPRRVGSAVQRNLVKRRIRAILAATELDTNRDIVVRAGGSAGAVRFQELEKHVIDALHSAGGIA